MNAVAGADRRAGFWTLEIDERMRQLAPDHSARQIAELVGASRNAVIGRCRRRKIDLASPATKIQRGPILRIPIRKASPKFGNILPTEYPGVKPSDLDAHCAKLQRKREAAMVAPAEDWQPLRVGLFEIRTGQCRWPLWSGSTPANERFFCGNAVKAARSYCPRCSALAFRPRQIAVDQDRKIRKAVAA